MNDASIVPASVSEPVVIDTNIPTSVPLVPPTEVSNAPVIATDTVSTPIVESNGTNAARPARRRKPKADTSAKPAKVEKRGRGRPNVYTGPILALIVSMIKACHNSSLVRQVLTAKGQSNDAKYFSGLRKSLHASTGIELLAKPGTISLPMLGKYAAEAGIEMPKGRPTFKLQEKQREQLERFVNKKAGKAADKAA